MAQPHIQKLLDRYAKLKAQEDLEQENADKTRSPASQNAHIADHDDDDDDGVEIEVEDDMEVKEDVKEDIKSANKLSYFAAGLATLITVIYLGHKWRSTQQQRIQEEAGKNLKRRFILQICCCLHKSYSVATKYINTCWTGCGHVM